ncbi:MAG: cupin domain-containing protein [Gemmatimonadetes bacterium]|nr:cupin domain-containing protein [Gemmatimonadota bacterium]
MKMCLVVPPGGGRGYDWSSDHTFVKVGKEHTGGAYTLMEDNLKPGFALGLHRHDHHAETFYVLEGPIDFYVNDEWIAAAAGTCIHVPPGAPHACRLHEGSTGRMLMIYQPSGFDGYLAELATLSESDFQDADRMTRLNAKYDLVELGPVPKPG